jgi:hypothetical protein
MDGGGRLQMRESEGGSQEIEEDDFFNDPLDEDDEPDPLGTDAEEVNEQDSDGARQSFFEQVQRVQSRSPAIEHGSPNQVSNLEEDYDLLSSEHGVGDKTQNESLGQSDHKKSQATPTSSLAKLGSRRSSKSKRSSFKGSRASRASKFERSSQKFKNSDIDMFIEPENDFEKNT